MIIVEPGVDTLADVEKRFILATLEYTNGNRSETARLLGVSVRTIRNKLRDWHVKHKPNCYCYDCAVDRQREKSEWRILMHRDARVEE